MRAPAMFLQSTSRLLSVELRFRETIYLWLDLGCWKSKPFEWERRRSSEQFKYRQQWMHAGSIG